MRRLLALLGAATAIGAATVPVAAAAGADPVSSCSTTKGVLVVVDFRHFGGSVTRGCDASITTGYDALHDAGFSTEGTRHDGPGFVCRIDGRPSQQQDPCVNTPPTTAYWSYWHADAGQRSWTYSTRGAQSYQPSPGSIDAWVFGGTDTAGSRGGPTFTPAQARSGSTAGGAGGGGATGGGTGHGGGSGGGGGATTKAHAPQPGTPAHRPHAGSSAAAGHRPAGSTGARGPSSATTGDSTSAGSAATRPASGATTPSASVGGVPGSGAAAGSGGPPIVDAKPAAATSRSGHGSALPVVLGLALAVLLAGGAGWTVLRRRRAEAADH